MPVCHVENQTDLFVILVTFLMVMTKVGKERFILVQFEGRAHSVGEGMEATVAPAEAARV